MAGGDRSRRTGHTAGVMREDLFDFINIETAGLLHRHRSVDVDSKRRHLEYAELAGGGRILVDVDGVPGREGIPLRNRPKAPAKLVRVVVRPSVEEDQNDTRGVNSVSELMDNVALSVCPRGVANTVNYITRGGTCAGHGCAATPQGASRLQRLGPAESRLIVGRPAALLAEMGRARDQRDKLVALFLDPFLTPRTQFLAHGRKILTESGITPRVASPFAGPSP